MNGPARDDILHFIETRHGRRLSADEAADIFRALDLDGDRAAAFMGDFAQTFGVDLAGYEPPFHHRVGLAATRFSWPVPVPQFFGVRLPLSVSDLTLAAQTGRWPLRYPTLTPVPARDWINWPLLLVALPLLAGLVIWVFRAV